MLSVSRFMLSLSRRRRGCGGLLLDSLRHMLSAVIARPTVLPVRSASVFQRSRLAVAAGAYTNGSDFDLPFCDCLCKILKRVRARYHVALSINNGVSTFFFRCVPNAFATS